MFLKGYKKFYEECYIFNYMFKKILKFGSNLIN